MIYCRRYMGDYLKKTSRLAMIEHGAYILLLDYYYVEEKPIPLDMNEVFRMVRAIAPQERQAVVRVLAAHFDRRDDGYHNKRADEEIAVAVQARTNGGNGGRPAKTGKVTGDETGTETGDVTGKVTGRLTGQGGGSGHPSTTNHQPSAATPQSSSAAGAARTPDGFEIVWKTLPRRAGSNPKRRAEQAYRARIVAGATPEEILDGAGRYARFCAVSDKIGTEFVMQAATFLGPELHFRNAWEAPVPAGGPTPQPVRICGYCQAKSIGNVAGIEYCNDHRNEAMDGKPRPRKVAVTA